MKTKREDIRNIAIIAHVDHGKTTLVDELLKQSGVFRENQEVAERVMDSNDIERERGITILSKNTAVYYKGTKINIIDTPGHADFGGEVERVLKMVNGVILVVDAFEGAMPQTKFVLRKALELDLPVIVCINKIDRPEARPDEVIDEVLELFMDLNASDEQLDCPFVYASAKTGVASMDPEEEGTDMKPLFETILNYIPAPEGDPDAHTQVLISTIDYNEYVGRIGIGKVDNGTIRVGMDAVVVNKHDPDRMEKVRISKLYEFDGLNKVDVKEASIGSIRCMVEQADSAVFYGLAMDDVCGIVVDNFSLRGASGLSIRNIPLKNLSDFNRLRPYDLIVVQYGLNVATDYGRDYSRYIEGMDTVIRRLKSAFPTASLLLIGVGDRDFRDEEGRVRTMPGIKHLVAWQQQLAADNGIAFWNLFEAMGGESSMARLEEAEPPMANHDYAHINFRGGKYLASLLYEALMHGKEQSDKLRYERK